MRATSRLTIESSGPSPTCRLLAPTTVRLCGIFVHPQSDSRGATTARSTAWSTATCRQLLFEVPAASSRSDPLRPESWQLAAELPRLHHVTRCNRCMQADKPIAVHLPNAASYTYTLRTSPGTHKAARRRGANALVVMTWHGLQAGNFGWTGRHQSGSRSQAQRGKQVTARRH